MLVRGAPTFESRWLAHAMNSVIGRSQVAAVQYGAAQEQFNIRHAVDFLFPVPPIDEQHDIVGHIGRATAKLDSLRLATERSITLLKERRAALIAAAVTGQIDVGTAARIRDALGFDLDERRELPTWAGALRRFIDQADAAGVLVMVSGVVGSNNRRKLDPREFRGFAPVDDLAPLVFVNGADTKAAQMFTLAHALVHVWLGQSALSDAEARTMPEHVVERWCNQVAAELLVPLAVVRDEYEPGGGLRSELDRLARRFKVSTLVVLRRIHDAGGLTREEYWEAYEAELERLRSLPKSAGGDFYLTLGARVSKRFARALVSSTLEGRSWFTEAFRLLGFKKMETFRRLGGTLGLVA